MNAHCLQHVSFEGLGSIGPWLKVNNCALTSTLFFNSPTFPDPRGVDLLVVLGGPMSVNDEAAYPWLVEEKRFIRHCIEADKAVLGICLGAQLIASAMGSRVFGNEVKEIGWFPISTVAAAGENVFSFPPVQEVFHWHGETFDLPPGALHLACSNGCRHQAFQLGRAVIGLQFHLETTPESARALVEHCRAELQPAKYVQSEADILAAPPAKYAAINALMDQVLSFLCRG